MGAAGSYGDLEKRSLTCCCAPDHATPAPAHSLPEPSYVNAAVAVLPDFVQEADLHQRGEDEETLYMHTLPGSQDRRIRLGKSEKPATPSYEESTASSSGWRSLQEAEENPLRSAGARARKTLVQKWQGQVETARADDLHLGLYAVTSIGAGSARSADSDESQGRRLSGRSAGEFTPKGDKGVRRRFGLKRPAGSKEDSPSREGIEFRRLSSHNGGEPQRYTSKGSHSPEAKAELYKEAPLAESLLSPEEECSASVQLQYGPQSKRGAAQQFQLECLERSPHAVECFAKFAARERELCQDWVVFYHSYAISALHYEVNAALANVLCGFDSEQASLPRIMMREFDSMPNAAALMEKFKTSFASDRRDHHPQYRAVAISAMCSLVALGPESSTPVVFLHTGYGHSDVPPLRLLLEEVLTLAILDPKQVKKLLKDIITLAEGFGLDASAFGGKAALSGKTGHMQQIFIRRDLVDELVYASHPWGPVDEERQPISSWLNSNANTSWGQARIVAHPSKFLSKDSVRIYVASADASFHAARPAFAKLLAQLLGGALQTDSAKNRALSGLCGGQPPQELVSLCERLRAAHE